MKASETDPDKKIYGPAMVLFLSCMHLNPTFQVEKVLTFAAEFDALHARIQDTLTQSAVQFAIERMETLTHTAVIQAVLDSISTQAEDRKRKAAEQEMQVKL